MIYFLYKIASRIGIDKAILYTSSARVMQGLGGVISVLLVANQLSDIEQGFYYTFASILSLQVFFELGLNNVIVQYVAHEVSHLTLVDDHYTGDQRHRSRISSLLRFCIHWILLAAGILFVVLAISGYVFFKSYYHSDTPVNWQLPWILLVIGTISVFVVTPFLSFLEGLGKIKEVAKIRMIQQLVQMVISWSGLIIGIKLYVGGVSTIITTTLLVILLLKKFFPFLRNIYREPITEKVNFKKEIFPYQWRIALSWVSGFFIFQLFNPVLFATEGAVVAGQMGMTITALGAILNLAFSWISTKIPLFSGLIAKKNYLDLDRLFNRTLWQSSLVNGIGLIVFFVIIFCFRHFDIEIFGKNLAYRFLSPLPLFFMMVPILLNHILIAWATYLRCHNKEPMMVYSIVMAILCSLSTFILGNKFGIIGMTSGYMALTILGCIWTYYIFKINKQKWHNE